MTWDEAMEYAKSLGDGWRLPSKEELKEAYDNKIEGFKSGYYWSSSTYVKSTTNAWGVGLFNGSVNSYSKANGYYVRCVREIKNA